MEIFFFLQPRSFSTCGRLSGNASLEDSRRILEILANMNEMDSGVLTSIGVRNSKQLRLCHGLIAFAKQFQASRYHGNG